MHRFPEWVSMVHCDLDVSKYYCLQKYVGEACTHTVSVGATTVKGLEVSSYSIFLEKKGRALIFERDNSGHHCFREWALNSKLQKSP